MKKAAVFVDVQNIYYTTQDGFGRKFNYRELWRQLSGEFDIVVANAYAIAREDSGQLKFVLGVYGWVVLVNNICVDCEVMNCGQCRDGMSC